MCYLICVDETVMGALVVTDATMALDPQPHHTSLTIRTFKTKHKQQYLIINSLQRDWSLKARGNVQSNAASGRNKTVSAVQPDGGARPKANVMQLAPLKQWLGCKKCNIVGTHVQHGDADTALSWHIRAHTSQGAKRGLLI